MAKRTTQMGKEESFFLTGCWEERGSPVIDRRACPCNMQSSQQEAPGVPITGPVHRRSCSKHLGLVWCLASLVDT